MPFCLLLRRRMSDTFEMDAPEMNSSSAGVKMLRERLEQQSREVHTHLAPPARGLLTAARPHATRVS